MKPPARPRPDPMDELLDDVEDLGLPIRNRIRQSPGLRKDPHFKSRNWSQLSPEEREASDRNMPRTDPS